MHWMVMSDASSKMLAVHVWDGMGWAGMGWGGSAALLVHVVEHRARAGPGPCLLGRAGQDLRTWLGTGVAIKPSSSARCRILRKHNAYCMEQDSLMDMDLHLINQFTHSVLTIQTLPSLGFKKRRQFCLNRVQLRWEVYDQNLLCLPCCRAVLGDASPGQV